MSRKTTTLWNFFFLNLGFIISVINGIAIIPIYLNYISSAVYGAWLATGNILTWITMVDPGVAGVLLQKISFAKGKDDKKEIGLIITCGVLISSALFLIALGIGIVLSNYIVDIAKIDRAYSQDIESSFKIALWGTSFNLLGFTFSNIILAYQKAKIHGFIINLINIISIVINLVLLVLNTGIYSLAYTSLFKGTSTLLYGIIFSLILIKKDKIIIEFNYSYFKNFSKIFSVTFANKLFDNLANNVDLVVVSRYLGSNAVTILDLSRRPIKLVNGITNNITISMLPSLAHLFGSGDNEKIRDTVANIWVAIFWTSSFIMGSFIIFEQSILSNWVGKEYWLGDGNNIIICMSFFIFSVGYGLSNITYSMGDIKKNSLVNLSRNILYFIFLVILYKIGITGILLSFLLPLSILIYYYPKKVFEIVNFTKKERNDLFKDSFLSILILIISIVVAINIDVQLDWIGIIMYGGIYCILYALILYLGSNRFKFLVNEKLLKRRRLN